MAKSANARDHCENEDVLRPYRWYFSPDRYILPSRHLDCPNRFLMADHSPILCGCTASANELVAAIDKSAVDDPYAGHRNRCDDQIPIMSRKDKTHATANRLAAPCMLMAVYAVPPFRSTVMLLRGPLMVSNCSVSAISPRCNEISSAVKSVLFSLVWKSPKYFWSPMARVLDTPLFINTAIAINCPAVTFECINPSPPGPYMGPEGLDHRLMIFGGRL